YLKDCAGVETGGYPSRETPATERCWARQAAVSPHHLQAIGGPAVERAVGGHERHTPREIRRPSVLCDEARFLGKGAGHDMHRGFCAPGSEHPLRVVGRREPARPRTRVPYAEAHDLHGIFWWHEHGHGLLQTGAHELVARIAVTMADQSGNTHRSRR